MAGLYRSHEPEILRLKKEDPRTPEFYKTLTRYQEFLGQIEVTLGKPGSGTPAAFSAEPAGLN